MIQYLLEKFETIKKQRNLYCTNVRETKDKKTKTIFIYDFICENTHGKGPEASKP